MHKPINYIVEYNASPIKKVLIDNLFTLEGVLTLEEASKRVAEMKEKLDKMIQIFWKLAYERRPTPAWLATLGHLQEILGVDDTTVAQTAHLSVDRWRALKAGKVEALFPEYDCLMNLHPFFRKYLSAYLRAYEREGNRVAQYTG